MPCHAQDICGSNARSHVENVQIPTKYGPYAIVVKNEIPVSNYIEYIRVIKSGVCGCIKHSITLEKFFYVLK